MYRFKIDCEILDLAKFLMVSINATFSMIKFQTNLMNSRTIWQLILCSKGFQKTLWSLRDLRNTLKNSTAFKTLSNPQMDQLYKLKTSKLRKRYNRKRTIMTLNSSWKMLKSILSCGTWTQIGMLRTSHWWLRSMIP